MGNSHNVSTLAEENGDHLVFDVSLIQGDTSFQCAQIWDMGSGAVKDKESEYNQMSFSTSSPAHSWASTCIWFLIAGLGMSKDSEIYNNKTLYNYSWVSQIV